jgi:hypothetical protein
MSTIKNPEEKKQLSLERDRRNRYGENSKSSRKSIQCGKQRRHMDERRTVGEVLGRLTGNVQEDPNSSPRPEPQTVSGAASRNGRIPLSESFWPRREPEKNQSSPLPKLGAICKIILISARFGREYDFSR